MGHLEVEPAGLLLLLLGAAERPLHTIEESGGEPRGARVISLCDETTWGDRKRNTTFKIYSGLWGHKSAPL